MSNIIKLKFLDGKYEYTFDGMTQITTRGGEPWRDDTGDNLMLAMAQRIIALEESCNNLLMLVDAIEKHRDENYTRNTFI